MRFTRPHVFWIPTVCVLSLLGGLAGCGSGDSAQEQAGTSTRAGAPGGKKALPTVAIGNPRNKSRSADEASTAESPKLEFKQGTPQWLLREITVLKVARLTSPPSGEKTTASDGTTSSPQLTEEDLEKQRAARRDRCRKIIGLAESAISLTHNNPEATREFDLAVHHLVESHAQLAFQGDKESTDALYETAALLYKRDPKSKAAAEAGYELAKFVQKSAERFATQDARWLKEFAGQARLFGDRFPQEVTRAAPLLFAAGQSCELNGLTDDARLCYERVSEKYADAPLGSQSTAILRRLNLTGQPLELAGPTIDGGFVKVADFKDRAVLVVFWSTNAKPFTDMLDDLLAATSRFPESKLAVIGVNLDVDESTVDTFLEEQDARLKQLKRPPISWRQIFHPDPAQRGWKHPIVAYYGVRQIPAIWLVGPDGRVASTDVKPQTLTQQVAALSKTARQD